MPERYMLQKKILVPARISNTQRKQLRTFESGTEFLYCYEINSPASSFVLLCRDYQKINNTKTNYSDLLKVTRADFQKMFIRMRDVINEECQTSSQE